METEHQFEQEIQGGVCHAGMLDALTTLQGYLDVARSYGCVLIAPRPWKMLGVCHNLGHRLNRSLLWDGYIEVPSDLRQAAPDQAIDAGTLAGAPSVEDMRRLQALGTPQQVAVLTVGSYRDIHSMKSVIAAGSPVARPDYRFEFQVARNLCEVADKEWRFAGGEGNVMTFHLRRGDMLRVHEDWSNCTAVAQVKRLARNFREDYCGSEDTVLVLTDECDGTYISELREAFLQEFRQVYFEWELPRAHLDLPRDNYRVERINAALISMSSCYFDLHPDNGRHRELCSAEARLPWSFQRVIYPQCSEFSTPKQ